MLFSNKIMFSLSKVVRSVYTAKASLALTIPAAAQATVNDNALFIVTVY